MERAEDEFMHMVTKGGEQRMLRERRENCRGEWHLPLTKQNTE